MDLYSTDEDKRLKNVRYRGYADYYTQMPLIFSQSRINLNISFEDNLDRNPASCH